MENPITDPHVPYVGSIYGGKFVPGRMVKIQGAVPGNAQRFGIHLQCGPKMAPRDDVALRLSVRFLEGYISLNSLENGTWGREQRDTALPVNRGEKFKIVLMCDVNQYMVAINGQHYYEYPQRLNYNRITHLTIDGDIDITQISYESPVESGNGTGAKVPSLMSSSGKNKIDKLQKKGSLTNKLPSPQVHTAPVPDLDDPSLPRRLSYEAAIYGCEGGFGYQEVNIIPEGAPAPKSATNSLQSRADSDPVYATPIAKSSAPRVNAEPVSEASSKNGAAGPPYTVDLPKNIPKPERTPSPPASVSIPLTAASSDIRPVKDTDCQTCWSNFFGVVVGGAFIMGFVLLWS